MTLSHLDLNSSLVPTSLQSHSPWLVLEEKVRVRGKGQCLTGPSLSRNPGLHKPRPEGDQLGPPPLSPPVSMSSPALSCTDPVGLMTASPDGHGSSPRVRGATKSGGRVRTSMKWDGGKMTSLFSLTLNCNLFPINCEWTQRQTQTTAGMALAGVLSQTESRNSPIPSRLLHTAQNTIHTQHFFKTMVTLKPTVK